MPIANRDALSEFLSPLAYGIHIATISVNGGTPQGRYFGDDIDGATAFAIERNATGHNVYFTANEPTYNCGDKPTKNQIVRLRCIFVDVDPPKDGSMFDKQKNADEIRRDNPTIIIDSGNGIQAFWFFVEPLGASPDTIAAVEAVNRALVRRYGGDPAATNVDRLMRLPGTVNWPTTAKRERGCVPCMAQVL